MTTRPGAKLRHILLAGVALCSTAPGLAQSAMQATAAPVAGAANAPVSTPVVGGFRDEVRVNNPTAVINWTPTDLGPGTSAINLLPVNNELRFVSALGTYTVLNRVVPISLAAGRAVALNGLVESFINVPPAAGPQQRGGNIWFYSPNGILVGGSGRFNVGSLALTTLDHPFNPVTGALTFSGAGSFQFGAGLNPTVTTSSVVVSPGATISANNGPGSYVALVSPRVEQRGSILVNGSAALVAADRVDMSFGVNNLVSINVITGSGDANGIVHTGSTVGTARSAANPDGQIYMTAVPKNQAITMLVGGTSGYQPATSAAIVNGAVVLTAGYDVQSGAPGFVPSGGGTGAASIRFADQGAGNIVVTSNLTGRASGNLQSAIAAGTQFTVRNTETTGNTFIPVNAAIQWDGATAANTANLDLTGVATTVSGDLTLRSGSRAQGADARLLIGPGGSLDVGGTMNVSSGGGNNPGNVGVVVNDGALNVAGQFILSADALEIFNAATAGQATLTVNGGLATIGGEAFILANATSGGSAPTSFDARGGTAALVLGAGATPTRVTFGGVTNTISANGDVQQGQFLPVNGGNGFGGSALVTVASGQLTMRGLAMTANANGGAATTGIAGNASAGTARVAMSAGLFGLETLSVRATERQGGYDTGTSGSTTGSGIAAVDVSGGTLDVGAGAFGGSLTISANAFRARAGLGAPATSGNVTAGTARLSATGTGTIVTDATAPSGTKAPVLVTASVVLDDTDPGASGGVYRAGSASVIADGGTMSLHRLDIRANAIERTNIVPADVAGAAFGGTATLAVRNGGILGVRAGQPTTTVSAYGAGGSASTPAPGAGGTIDVAAQGGTLTLADGMTVDARGYSGTAQGGTGGTITVRSLAGAAAQPGSLAAGAVALDASGQISAAQPNGTAGTITVSNTGAGQTMTFASLFARAGAANGGVSGAITLTADNAPITTTANAGGIDLATLGTLTLNGVGAAGSISAAQVGFVGTANDIVVTHSGVVPGSTSTISSPLVRLTAGRDQLHTGSVTIRTADATLSGLRTLGGVDSVVISTGDINIGSGLSASTTGTRFRVLDATGLLRGYQGVSSFTPEITTPGSFTIGERAFAGAGNIDIRAGTGIDIADAGTSATGQVLLNAATGDVRLATSGVALATRPNGITMIAQAGSARFTNILSRASISIGGASGIVGGSASAAFGVLLTSSGGSISTANLSATGVTANAAGSITAANVFGATGINLTATNGSVVATSSTGNGNVTISGASGVDVATVAGTNITLSAPNGPVRVATDLRPAGSLIVNGQSLFLRAVGSLATGTLAATGVGGIDVATGGALTLASVQAANGPVTLSGATGLTVPTVTSGGATTLSAANGAINIATNLQSAGLVTANGRSVFLRATGPLAAGTLSATAGNVDVASGAALAATIVQATSDVILGSGAAMTPGSITAGRDIVLNAQSLTAAALAATRDLRITSVGMTMATGTLSAARNLAITAGQTNFQGLNGGTVSVTSGQGVIFTTMTSDGATTLTAGDDIVGTGIVSTGNLAATLGRNLALGSLQSGGNATFAGSATTSNLAITGTSTVGGTLTATGANLALGAVTAGNLIATAAGGLTAGPVTATEDIRLAAGGPPSVLTTAALTAGDDIVLSGNLVTSGNLTTTGLGPDVEGNGRTIDINANRIAAGVVDSAGSILLAAAGPITYASARAATSTELRTFGTIFGGNLTSGTTLRVFGGGNIDIGAVQGAGAVEITNFFSPGATSTIRTGDVSGGTVLISSVLGLTTTGNVTGTGDVQINGAGGVTIASARSTSGAVTVNVQTAGPVNSGALNAATSVGVQGRGGPVQLTTIDAGTNILVANASGALTFTRATAGGFVGGSATGNIGFGSITAGQTVQFQTPGTLVGTSVTANGGGANSLQGDAGVDVGTVVTAGDTTLRAVNGALTIGELRAARPVIAVGRSVTLRSSGALNATSLTATAGAIDVGSGGALTVGAATANDALTLASGAVATINGVATGSTVAVASNDIVIAATGRLGTLGTTTQLTLTNNSTANRTTLGGAGTTGYSLSATEVGRLTANNITIVAPVVGTASTAFNSARTPDVTVEGFALAGGTNLAANGTFSLQTGGRIRVTGVVALTGMTNANTLAMRGDEQIDILDSGRITMNGTGGLAGTIDLTSRNIVAASSAALADFTAAPTLTAISDRAGRNDGAVDDGGYLQANAIRATLLNSTLIIQNTGASNVAGNRDYAGRRGFTVGAGGFTIVQGGTNPVRVAINGRAVGATTPSGAPTLGGFVTGLDTIPLISFVPQSQGGSAGQPSAVIVVDPFGRVVAGPTTGGATTTATASAVFDPTSTANGCVIVNVAACRIVPNDPIRDIVRSDFGEGSANNWLPLALIQLKENEAPEDEPLIDEPVTGAGNDDLWSVGDGKGRCDPARENCPPPR